MADFPLAPGESVRIRGQRWNVTASGGAVVHVRGCDTDNRHVAAAFLTGVERIDRLPPPAPRVVRLARWRRAARAALAHATPPGCIAAARDARIDILPYQLEPVIAVVRGLAVRLLIADEVGLGKTVQAGLIAAEVLARAPEGCALVVCPAGLREQWHAELLNRFGIAAALIDAASLGGAAGGTNPWMAGGVAVVSIDFVKRPEVLRSLEAVVWDLVVFDEAHVLSGRSDRAAAARAIADRARVVVLLTATPHSGDDTAFERLQAIGDIDRRFPLLLCRRTRHDAGITTVRRTTWLRVRQSAAERAMHAAVAEYAHAVWLDRGRSDPAARLVAAVLARRACSSAAALARSIERRLELVGIIPVNAPQPTLPFADDEVDEALLAVSGLEDAGVERRMLDRLLALARQAAAGESKLAALRRLLRRVREPAIVFTEYRDTLTILAGALAGFSPAMLHGALTRSERHRAVESFTRGGARLLLATDAASEGLNLQARCRLVVNLELPWTPLRLEQRIGRVERIGQPRRVHGLHLVGRGTSEEETASTLRRRTRSVKQAIGAMASPEVPDLRRQAAEEAARILTARRLGANTPRVPPIAPLVARSRKRGRRFACCCAYRFVLADAERSIAADYLAGFTVASLPVEPHDARRRLVHAETLLLPHILGSYGGIAAAYMRASEAGYRLAVDREEAILGALVDRQARLARGLVQRGLFDRRSERRADAQTAVLQEACDRCRERLRELRAFQAVRVERHSLAFALLAD